MIADGVFQELDSNCVKDLYWLLFSDCPINNNHPLLSEIPFFPLDILENWKQTSKDYFLRLDKSPEDLEHFLDRPKNVRLGFYAEALLSYFFQTFPEVELLLQNYQVIDDKRTIGEIDFIITWENRVIHLECAVKYYLFDHSKNKDQLQNWIGPSCNDNLDRKILKVRDHQLPLIRSKSLADEIGTLNIESYLFLKGKLFVNSNVECAWINSKSLGKYYFYNQIMTNELSLIKKPFWLGVFEGNQYKNSLSTVTENDFSRRAQLVSSPEGDLFFVAPNVWPLNS